jgi:predicted RNA-binding Zn-ribbon protein involved in translation (DUF1610 family)
VRTTGGVFLSNNEQNETPDQEKQFEHSDAAPANGSRISPNDGTDESMIDSIGSDITESIRSVLQILLHQKEQLASTMQAQEQQIDEEAQDVLSQIEPHESSEILKGYERRRYELYHSYLKQLGDLGNVALHNLMEHLHPLSEPNKLFALAIHELEDSIKEIDRSRRKFAVDLKKRLDEKRYTSLEARYQQLLQEREAEAARMAEVQKELDDLTRNLGMNQTELRRRIAGEDEWKDAYSRDLRKVLIQEIRETLEKEIRSDMEKRIRAEMEDELKHQMQAQGTGSRIRQVRKSGSNGQSQNSSHPQAGSSQSQQTVPFVKCPSCSERIEIQSTQRPVDIQCPKCGSEYTIREKAPQNPDEGTSSNSNGGVAKPSPEENDPDKPLSQNPAPYELPRPSVPMHGTKEITCPHCGKTHVVPHGLTTRLTCVCGRRIKT